MRHNARDNDLGRRRARRWWLVVSLACVAWAAHAHESEDAAKAPLTQVQHKAKLVAHVLEGSSTVKRIDAGNDPASHKLIGAARAAYAQATAALSAQDVETATQALDEAMRLVSEARSRLAAQADANPHASENFVAMLSSTRSLRDGIAKRLGAKRAASHPSLARVNGLIDEGWQLARSGRPDQGMARLRDAESQLSRMHAEMIGGNTLDYTEPVGTPAQRYAAAAARNRGFAELVPVAITELKTDAARTARLNAVLDTNRAERDAAEQEAAARRFDAATERLERATQALEHSLQSAGLTLTRALGE